MKIIDEQLLQEFREKTSCEWCKRRIFTGLQPHHIFTRGAGRLDIRCNLVALCIVCHGEVHAGVIMREDLLTIVAVREGTPQDEIEREIYRLRRLRK